MAVFCPQCGAKCDEHDKFCAVCGSLIDETITCKRCGAVAPMSAAYCPSCGISFIQNPEMAVHGPVIPETHPQTVPEPLQAERPHTYPVPPMPAVEEPVEPLSGHLHLSSPAPERPAPPADVREESTVESTPSVDNNKASSQDTTFFAGKTATAASDKHKQKQEERAAQQEEKRLAREKEMQARAEARQQRETERALKQQQKEEKKKQAEEERERRRAARNEARETAAVERGKELSKNKASSELPTNPLVVFWMKLIGTYPKDAEPGPDEDILQEDESIFDELDREQNEMLSEDDDWAVASMEEELEEKQRTHAERKQQKKKEKKARGIRAKQEAEEEGARARFAEIANTDGYYSDRKPDDYGWAEEEGSPVSVASIVLLIIGVVVVVAFLLWLQKYLTT